MALAPKKNEEFYKTSGSDADKISPSRLAEIKDLWDKDVASYYSYLKRNTDYHMVTGNSRNNASTWKWIGE